MLTTCILLDLGVIVVLCLALSVSNPLRGPDFILGGTSAGFVSSVADFLVTQQVLSLGQIMPYCSMASPDPHNKSMKLTLDADYWPYEWPIVRLRALRNGHYFFYFVDLVMFVSVSTVVQFASNTFRAVYDEEYNFLGYLPNKGMRYITISCFASFTIITIATLLWLWRKRTTGLLAAPGSIAMYLAMLHKSDFCNDYCGVEGESRRWVVRDRLRANVYRIGYWKDPGDTAVYGIRKTRNSDRNISGEIIKAYPPKPYLIPPQERPQPHATENQIPRFAFIPWFLRPFSIAISSGLLTAALSTALTLLINDDIIAYGFSPGVSTKTASFVEMSPAGFLWSFLPSLAADQYRLLIKSIDMFHRLTQPYTDLRRNSSNTPLTAFTLNYTKDLPIFITISALTNRHWKVAFLLLFSLLSSLIPTLAANMFYPNYDGQFIYVEVVKFSIVIAYMGLLILVLLAAIPDETRYMPHEIETISDHISLLSQSSLLNSNKYQYTVPLPSQPQEAQGPPPQKATKRQRFFAATRASFSQFKHVSLAKLKTLKPSHLSPPVAAVTEKLSGLEPNDMPRLGIWQRDDKSFALGIDSKEKMLSLFDNDHYKWDIGKRAREALL
jgi:hypothetical protein